MLPHFEHLLVEPSKKNVTKEKHSIDCTGDLSSLESVELIMGSVLVLCYKILHT